MAGRVAPVWRETPERITMTGWLRHAGHRRPPLVLLVPCIAVLGAMLLPIAYLLMRSSEAGRSAVATLLRPRTVDVTLNTLVLALTVSVTAIVLGTSIAWIVTRTDIPGRSFWAVAGALPLVIPSYVGALTMIGALSPRGLAQHALERPFGVDRLPPIYGFAGSWLTLSLFTFPYVYLSVAAAMRGLDPALEEAARCLGLRKRATLFRAILPQLRPAIAGGGLLAALYTVSDFGVVSLMRYDVFTRAIYTQYRSAFDRTAGALLALVLIVLTVSLLVAESRIRGKARLHRIAPGSRADARRVALGKLKPVAFAYCALVACASLGLPMLMLGYWIVTGASGGDRLQHLPDQAWNTVLAAASGGLITAGAALPIAILVVRYRNRVTDAFGRAAFLGFALPGIVIAIALVYFGANFAPVLYGTPAMLLLGYCIRFLPQALTAERVSLLQVSPRLEEAARLLGMSQSRTWLRVTIPLAAPGIAIGATLVMLTVMKELPVTLLLAPIGFDTLATGLWQATSTGSYGRAAAPSLALIALSAVPSIVLLRRTARSGSDAGSTTL